ncbi:MAG: DUF4097 family beta strand repeat protein [Clostridia bacterium]|nr:DUF4097 family beta strand repeat protein [Clostridia bacterium]
MKKIFKILLVLSLIGCLALTISLFTGCKINYEQNFTLITENYENIYIDVDTADITFLFGDKTSVSLYEHKKDKHTVKVENDTLIIQNEGLNRILFSSGVNIKITLDKKEYKDLNIKNSTGDVNFYSQFTFDNILIEQSTGDVTITSNVLNKLSVEVSTGDIELRNLTANEVVAISTTGDIDLSEVNVNTLNISADTGEVSLTATMVQNKATIKTDTGDVDFVRSDFGELEVETDTGDVEGTILSSKIFIVYTDTGRKRVPETTTGGVAKITTDTGDIIITIVQ